MEILARLEQPNYKLQPSDIIALAQLANGNPREKQDIVKLLMTALRKRQDTIVEDMNSKDPKRNLAANVQREGGIINLIEQAFNKHKRGKVGDTQNLVELKIIEDIYLSYLMDRIVAWNNNPAAVSTKDVYYFLKSLRAPSYESRYESSDNLSAFNETFSKRLRDVVQAVGTTWYDQVKNQEQYKDIEISHAESHDHGARVERLETQAEIIHFIANNDIAVSIEWLHQQIRSCRKYGEHGVYNDESRSHLASLFEGKFAELFPKYLAELIQNSSVEDIFKVFANLKASFHPNCTPAQALAKGMNDQFLNKKVRTYLNDTAEDSVMCAYVEAYNLAGILPYDSRSEYAVLKTLGSFMDASGDRMAQFELQVSDLAKKHGSHTEVYKELMSQLGLLKNPGASYVYANTIKSLFVPIVLKDIQEKDSVKRLQEEFGCNPSPENQSALFTATFAALKECDGNTFSSRLVEALHKEVILQAEESFKDLAMAHLEYQIEQEKYPQACLDIMLSDRAYSDTNSRERNREMVWLVAHSFLQLGLREHISAISSERPVDEGAEVGPKQAAFNALNDLYGKIRGILPHETRRVFSDDRSGREDHITNTVYEIRAEIVGLVVAEIKDRKGIEAAYIFADDCGKNPDDQGSSYSTNAIGCKYELLPDYIASVKKDSGIEKAISEAHKAAKTAPQGRWEWNIEGSWYAKTAYERVADEVLKKLIKEDIDQSLGTEKTYFEAPLGKIREYMDFYHENKDPCALRFEDVRKNLEKWQKDIVNQQTTFLASQTAQTTVSGNQALAGRLQQLTLVMGG